MPLRSISHLYHGCCLEVMRDLPDQSMDLIATDPPYYRVKEEKWDRQWASQEEYLGWMGKVIEEFKRLLKPNGSLYLFASPYMATQIELTIRRGFHILNRIIWVKEEGHHRGCHKESLRKYFPQTEYILFAEHVKGDQGYQRSIQRLRREYVSSKKALQNFQDAQERRAEIEVKYANAKAQLQKMRRPFKVTKEDPYTDVWYYHPIQHYPGKHPCEKPIAMMEHIVRASSKPGAVVLDCFMGSGNMGVACIKHGRGFIGIEKDAKYYQQARERISGALVMAG